MKYYMIEMLKDRSAWKPMSMMELTGPIAQAFIRTHQMKKCEGRNDCVEYYWKQIAYDEALAIKFVNA